jgi:DNA helicase-2/ATP-dependent DNA helicase PcrA
MSVNEPGGLAEERRLFYVGITRARKRLFLSLATSRAAYGDVSIAMPSRFLSEIPSELITWRDSGGGGYSGTRSIGGSGSRGFGSRAGSGGRSAGFRAVSARSDAERPKTEWKSSVGAIRDNGDLKLAVGERIRHDDFGDGRVVNVIENGPRTVAEVEFESRGRKRLLVKVAPITKL